MTLGDGKRKVLELLDEYSSGGQLTTDADINNKMSDFFDMAQKDMALHRPIINEVTIDMAGRDYVPLPKNFRNYFAVWKDGKPYKKPRIIGGKIYAGGSTDTILIEYISNPKTIDMDTPDSYEFEVSEEAANCLPFYVAAQQLITDLVVDYGALWQMYQAHKAMVNPTIEGGQSRVRQSLFYVG